MSYYHSKYKESCLTPITVPFKGQPFRGTGKEDNIAFSITIIMTLPRFNKPQVCFFVLLEFQLRTCRSSFTVKRHN